MSLGCGMQNILVAVGERSAVPKIAAKSHTSPFLWCRCTTPSAPFAGVHPLRSASPTKALDM